MKFDNFYHLEYSDDYLIFYIHNVSADASFSLLLNISCHTQEPKQNFKPNSLFSPWG